MVNFGITGPETIDELGINAKMNEFQAAVGLCVLDEMEANLQARKQTWLRYEQELPKGLQLQLKDKTLGYNYAYFPVVFETEAQVVHVAATFEEHGILARRYFYPSLERVACLDAQSQQPVSADIAGRILCLPIYADLTAESQKKILKIMAEVIDG